MVLETSLRWWLQTTFIYSQKMEKSFSPVLMKRLFQITKTEAHYILSSADELKETYKEKN